MTGRRFARSKSQVGTYERCPRAYEFNYVKRIKFSSYWMVKGIACHAAIAAYFNAKLETGTGLVLADALTVFRESVAEWFGPLAEAQGKSPVLFDDQSREKLETEGEAQLRAYLSELAPTIEPLMVEEAAELTLPSGVRLMGRLDLVDTSLRIRDAKFPTDIMKTEDLHYDADAPFYCALFREKTGRWPAGFTFDVAALGRKKVPEPKTQSLDFPEFGRLMPALVESRLADLERIDEAILAGIFPRRPSVMNCNKCVYTNLCWHGQRPGVSVHTEAERAATVPAVQMSLAGHRAALKVPDIDPGHESIAAPNAPAGR